MEVTGHKTESVFLRYRIKRRADIRRGLDMLAEYVAAKAEEQGHGEDREATAR
jgi:hypothetical protein